MGMKASSGLFKNTLGALKYELMDQFFASKKQDGVYSSTGHVSLNSVSKYREYFYDKTAQQISSDMEKLGYDTSIKKSSHANSKAEIIVVSNFNTRRNITQIQVSPGSKRHGDNIPYVKISLTKPLGPKKFGKIKVVNANRNDYKTDGNEKAYIYTRRKKK